MSTHTPQILVVDDERHIIELIQLYLAREGFAIETANTGDEAIEKFRSRQPDMVLLDLMLPDQDGFEVCKKIRAIRPDARIVMLTARDDDVDRIVGLELGADKYLTKPFNPRVLLAEIRALLRTSQSEAAPGDEVIRVGDVVIDADRREVTVAGKGVDMRAKEFDLLTAFAKNVGKVLDRAKLLDTVWGYEYFGDTRTIDVHVTWLRDKLAGSTAQIQTVWGVGYKLVVTDTPSNGRGGRRG